MDAFEPILVNTPAGRSPRNRHRRGDAMMEIAFFILPSFAVICGFIDVGFAMFTWTTLQNAVREGCRYAITYQTDASGTQIQSIKDQVATWSMNMVNKNSVVGSAGSPPYVQVNFYTPPDASNTTGTLVSGTNSNASGNIVEVSIQRYSIVRMAPFSGSLVGPFYATPGSSMTIAVYSADVLGGQPSTGLPTP